MGILIVNSDDFGKNHLVSQGIVYCFENGFCSSTTLMANGDCFEEACELAHEKKLYGHIGAHIVLDDGYTPLTDKMKRCKRFCDKEGRFRKWKHMFYLTSDEKKAVYEEILGQIKKIASAGIPITHLDSHHHMHEEWAISSMMIQVAKQENIPFIRSYYNIGKLDSQLNRCYRAILNQRLRMYGLARTKNFGSLHSFMWHIENISEEICESCEVMIHPILDENGNVVDQNKNQRDITMKLNMELFSNIVSYIGKKYK